MSSFWAIKWLPEHGCIISVLELAFVFTTLLASSRKEKNREKNKYISEGQCHQDAGCEQKCHRSLNKELCWEHRVLSVHRSTGCQT